MGERLSRSNDSVGQYCARLLPIYVVTILLSAGCRISSHFSETVSRDEARARLLTGLPIANSDLQILHHRLDTTKSGEFWVFITSGFPDLEWKSNHPRFGQCPAISVFQFASACKIDQDILEPKVASSLESQEGTMWEWEIDDHTWRLRCVEGTAGFLCIAEKTP